MMNKIILLIKTFIIDIFFFNKYLPSTYAVPDTFWQQVNRWNKNRYSCALEDRTD